MRVGRYSGRATITTEAKVVINMVKAESYCHEDHHNANSANPMTPKRCLHTSKWESTPTALEVFPKSALSGESLGVVLSGDLLQGQSVATKFAPAVYPLPTDPADALVLPYTPVVRAELFLGNYDNTRCLLASHNRGVARSTATCPQCVENQGECKIRNGGLECVCMPNFYGTRCENECKCDPVGTQECVRGSSGGRCVCKQGYTGAECNLALAPNYVLVTPKSRARMLAASAEAVGLPAPRRPSSSALIRRLQGFGMKQLPEHLDTDDKRIAWDADELVDSSEEAHADVVAEVAANRRALSAAPSSPASTSSAPQLELVCADGFKRTDQPCEGPGNCAMCRNLYHPKVNVTETRATNHSAHASFPLELLPYDSVPKNGTSITLGMQQSPLILTFTHEIVPVGGHIKLMKHANDSAAFPKPFVDFVNEEQYTENMTDAPAREPPTEVFRIELPLHDGGGKHTGYRNFAGRSLSLLSKELVNALEANSSYFLDLSHAVIRDANDASKVFKGWNMPKVASGGAEYDFTNETLYAFDTMAPPPTAVPSTTAPPPQLAYFDYKVFEPSNGVTADPNSNGTAAVLFFLHFDQHVSTGTDPHLDVQVKDCGGVECQFHVQPPPVKRFNSTGNALCSHIEHVFQNLTDGATGPGNEKADCGFFAVDQSSVSDPLPAAASSMLKEFANYSTSSGIVIMQAHVDVTMEKRFVEFHVAQNGFLQGLQSPAHPLVLPVVIQAAGINTAQKANEEPMMTTIMCSRKCDPTSTACCSDPHTVNGICRPLGCPVNRFGATCERQCDCHAHGTAFCNDGFFHPQQDRADGTCVCKTGFAGAKCDQCAPGYINYPHCNKVCVGKTPCDARNTASCAGPEGEGPGQCQCKPGFNGPMCDVCADGYYGNSCSVACNATIHCSGNGQCGAVERVVNGQKQDILSCTCNSGFTGNDCSECDSVVICNGRGVCGRTLVREQLANHTEMVPQHSHSQQVVVVNATNGSNGTIVLNQTVTTTTHIAGNTSEKMMNVTHTDMCHCEGFFWGKNCEHDAMCSQKGTQSVNPFTGECNCKPLFYGTKCESECNCYSDKVRMNGNTAFAPLAVLSGTCNDGNTGDGSCTCFDGFNGTRCETCADFRVPSGDCSQNCTLNCDAGGTQSCSSSSGCQCWPWRGGQFCETCKADYYPAPPGSCSRYCKAETTCSGNGVCDLNGDCVCEAAFTGPNCDQCAVGYFPKQDMTLRGPILDAANSQPPHGVTAVSLAENLILKFSEPIRFANLGKNFLIRKVADAGTPNATHPVEFSLDLAVLKDQPFHRLVSGQYLYLTPSAVTLFGTNTSSSAAGNATNAPPAMNSSGAAQSPNPTGFTSLQPATEYHLKTHRYGLFEDMQGNKMGLLDTLHPVSYKFDTIPSAKSAGRSLPVYPVFHVEHPLEFLKPTGSEFHVVLSVYFSHGISKKTSNLNEDRQRLGLTDCGWDLDCASLCDNRDLDGSAIDAVMYNVGYSPQALNVPGASMAVILGSNGNDATYTDTIPGLLAVQLSIPADGPNPLRRKLQLKIPAGLVTSSDNNGGSDNVGDTMFEFTLSGAVATPGTNNAPNPHNLRPCESWTPSSNATVSSVHAHREEIQWTLPAAVEQQFGRGEVKILDYATDTEIANFGHPDAGYTVSDHHHAKTVRMRLPDMSNVTANPSGNPFTEGRMVYFRVMPRPSPGSSAIQQPLFDTKHFYLLKFANETSELTFSDRAVAEKVLADNSTLEFELQLSRDVSAVLLSGNGLSAAFTLADCGFDLDCSPGSCDNKPMTVTSAVPTASGNLKITATGLTEMPQYGFHGVQNMRDQENGRRFSLSVDGGVVRDAYGTMSANASGIIAELNSAFLTTNFGHASTASPRVMPCASAPPAMPKAEARISQTGLVYVAFDKDIELVPGAKGMVRLLQTGASGPVGRLLLEEERSPAEDFSVVYDEEFDEVASLRALSSHMTGGNMSGGQNGSNQTSAGPANQTSAGPGPAPAPAPSPSPAAAGPGPASTGVQSLEVPASQLVVHGKYLIFASSMQNCTGQGGPNNVPPEELGIPKDCIAQHPFADGIELDIDLPADVIRVAGRQPAHEGPRNLPVDTHHFYSVKVNASAFASSGAEVVDHHAMFDPQVNRTKVFLLMSEEAEVVTARQGDAIQVENCGSALSCEPMARTNVTDVIFHSNFSTANEAKAVVFSFPGDVSQNQFRIAVAARSFSGLQQQGSAFGPQSDFVFTTERYLVRDRSELTSTLAKCSFHCNCVNGDCDPNTGACRCPPKPQNSVNGFYGAACQYHSSCHEQNTLSAHGVGTPEGTGECTCKPGFFRPDCSGQCACHAAGTLAGGQCDPYTGACSCKPGWTGARCDQCAAGFVPHGICALSCLPKLCDARGTMACSSTNCVCKPGFFGDLCQNKCDCHQRGSRSCNQQTGACECIEGWGGAKCDQCATDYYPAGQCYTHCNAGTTCNGNGVCAADGSCNCQTNWAGNYDCSQCGKDYYGADCGAHCVASKNCTAASHGFCDPVDGSCNCYEGWHGPQCASMDISILSAEVCQFPAGMQNSYLKIEADYSRSTLVRNNVTNQTGFPPDFNSSLKHHLTYALNATGLAHTPNLRFSQAFDMAAIDVSRGSIAGGTQVKVTGRGFGFENGYHEVFLVYNTSFDPPDPSSTTCKIPHVLTIGECVTKHTAHGEFTCITPNADDPVHKHASFPSWMNVDNIQFAIRPSNLTATKVQSEGVCLQSSTRPGAKANELLPREIHTVDECRHECLTRFWQGCRSFSIGVELKAGQCVLSYDLCTSIGRFNHRSEASTLQYASMLPYRLDDPDSIGYADVEHEIPSYLSDVRRVNFTFDSASYISHVSNAYAFGGAELDIFVENPLQSLKDAVNGTGESLASRANRKHQLPTAPMVVIGKGMDWDSALGCEVSEWRYLPDVHPLDHPARLQYANDNSTAAEALRVKCTLGNNIPAGLYEVKVYQPNMGYTLGRSSEGKLAAFTSLFEISGVSSLHGTAPAGSVNATGPASPCASHTASCYPLQGGLGGGVDVNIHGRGFGTAVDQNAVTICGKPAEVQAASYNMLTVRSPRHQNLELLNELYFNNSEMNDRDRMYFYEDIRVSHELSEPARIFGTHSGAITDNSFWQFMMLFDNDLVDYPTLPGSDCSVGFTLPEGYLALVKQVKFYPPYSQDDRATLRNTRFQIANDTSASGYTTMHTIPGSGYVKGGWNTVDLDGVFIGRVFRYLGQSSSGCKMREIKFTGYVIPASAYASGLHCPVVVEKIKHPDAHYEAIANRPPAKAGASEDMASVVAADSFQKVMVASDAHEVSPMPSRMQKIRTSATASGFVSLPNPMHPLEPVYPRDYARFVFLVDDENAKFHVRVTGIRHTSESYVLGKIVPAFTSHLMGGNSSSSGAGGAGAANTTQNRTIDLGRVLLAGNANAVHTTTLSAASPISVAAKGVYYLDLTSYVYTSNSAIVTSAVIHSVEIDVDTAASSTAGMPPVPKSAVRFLRTSETLKHASSQEDMHFQAKYPLTPFITDVDPRNGTARGNTLVTLSGRNLDDVLNNPGPGGVTPGDFAPLFADNTSAEELSLFMQVLTQERSGEQIADRIANMTATSHFTNITHADYHHLFKPRFSELAFNGYDCTEVGSWANRSHSEIQCRTAPRSDGIKPSSFSVRIPGKGFAFRSDRLRIFYRYLDKWSDPANWLNEELPRRGDSAWVPEGQAILVDQSVPQLGLTYVAGVMVFDNTKPRLTYDSTWFWVHGGTLEIGTDLIPYENEVVLTLHGDKYRTVELPYIGQKMVVVTNQGNLGGDSSIARKIGMLDIHGRRTRNCVRLAVSANPGEDFVIVDSLPNWEPGYDIVFAHPVEEAILKSANVTLYDKANNMLVIDGVPTVVSGDMSVGPLFGGGMGNPMGGSGAVVEMKPPAYEEVAVLFLRKPLANYHEATRYRYFAENDPMHTIPDLRPHICTLSRNVVIQGSPDSHLADWGVHTGAFYGGEYRLKDVEVRNCGQGGQMGRYCTHFHKMSPGRQVDVYKSYVHNCAIHHSFMRGVVAHSTRFTVAEGNVGYLIKAHNMQIENGDEKETKWRDNVFIKALPMVLGLADDTTPATYWAVHGSVIWESNVGYASAFGYRFNPKGEFAGESIQYNHMLNNTAVGCGMAIQFFPAWQPNLDLYVNKFTALHCGPTLFVKLCNNCHYWDFNVIEPSGVGYVTKFTDPGHTPPRPMFQNWLMVGDMEAPNRRNPGLAFYFNGKDGYWINNITIVNWGDQPPFAGCFNCPKFGYLVPMYRMSKVSLVNVTGGLLWTESYSRYPIWWDMDGSVSGYPHGGYLTGQFGFNAWTGANLQAHTPQGVAQHAGAAAYNRESTGQLCRFVKNGEISKEMHCNREHVHVRFTSVTDFTGYALPNFDNHDLRVSSSAGHDDIPYNSMACSASGQNGNGWCFPLVLAKHNAQHVAPPPKVPGVTTGQMPMYESTIGHTPYSKYEQLPFWYTFDPYPTPMDFMKWSTHVSHGWARENEEWCGTLYPYFRPNFRKVFQVGKEFSNWDGAHALYRVRNEFPDAQKLNEFPTPYHGHGAHAMFVQLGSFSNSTGQKDMVLHGNGFCDTAGFRKSRQAYFADCDDSNTPAQRTTLSQCKALCLLEAQCKFMTFRGSGDGCCARFAEGVCQLSTGNHDYQTYRKIVVEHPGGQFQTDGTATTGWTNETDVPEIRQTRSDTHLVTHPLDLYEVQQSMNKFGMLTRDWRDRENPEKLIQRYLSTFETYTIERQPAGSGIYDTVSALGRDDLDAGTITVPTNLTFSYTTTDFRYQQELADMGANGSLAVVHSLKSEWSTVNPIAFQCPVEGCPIAPAQTSATAQLWHNPDTWPDGKVPEPNSVVTVDEFKSVILTAETAPVRRLTVLGKLTFMPPLLQNDYCMDGSSGNFHCPVEKPCRKNDSPSMLTCREYETFFNSTNRMNNFFPDSGIKDMCADGWTDCANHTTVQTLRVHTIQLHGQLFVGSKPYPYMGNAEILMHGPESCPPLNEECRQIYGEHGEGWPGITMRNGIDMNNKVIGVLGELQMHGKPLSCPWTTLAKTANPTDNHIFVDCLAAATEWKVGMEIEITPSEYPYSAPEIKTQAEVLRITSLSVVTDGMTFENQQAVRIGVETLVKKRHFAGKIQAGNEQIWFKAHVALLDRNVKIQSAETVDYKDNSNSKLREQGYDHDFNHGAGVTVIDNEDGSITGVASLSSVYFRQTGKMMYQIPSLYFFSGDGRDFSASAVEGCSFFISGFEAVKIAGPANLRVRRNFMSRLHGPAVHVFRGKDTIIEENLGSTMWRHIDERLRTIDSVYWPRAMFQTYDSHYDGSVAILQKNVASGSWDHGFIFRPPACGNTAQRNVYGAGLPDRQSSRNHAYGNLVGFHIRRGCDRDGGGPKACAGTGYECVTAEYLSAWKNAHIGITWADQPSNLRIRKVTVADNHIGITGHFHRQERDSNLEFTLEYSDVLGTTDISTCSDSLDGKSARASDLYQITTPSVVGRAFRHVGIMAPLVTNRGFTCEDGPNIPDSQCMKPKALIPDRTCAMPWENRYGIRGSRYGKFLVDTIKIGFFHHKDARLHDTPVGKCGRNSVAITYNPTSRDYNPSMDFRGVTWVGHNQPNVQRRLKIVSSDVDLVGGEAGRENDHYVKQLDYSNAGNIWHKLDDYFFPKTTAATARNLLLDEEAEKALNDAQMSCGGSGQCALQKQLLLDADQRKLSSPWRRLFETRKFSSVTGPSELVSAQSRALVEFAPPPKKRRRLAAAPEDHGVADGRFYLSYFRGKGSSDTSCDYPGCPGMFHFWLSDLDGTLTGKQVANPAGRATVLPDVSALTDATKCTDPAKGSYVCQNMQMALLNWDSADHDCCGWDRRELGQFAITRKTDGRVTAGQHMFDHLDCPRGCEFGHSFYPMAVEVKNEYQLVIPASMPEESFLHFFSFINTEWVVVKIYMMSPLKIRPYIDGEAIDDLTVGGDKLSKQVPIHAFGAADTCTRASPCAGSVAASAETAFPHGAHVQNPQEKFFTIVMRGLGGTVAHTYNGRTQTNSAVITKRGIFLQRIAVLQVDMTMSMDITAWEANAAANELSFRNSIATLLGIPLGRIKVVDVKAGSVKINYEVEEDKPVLSSTAVESKETPADSVSSQAPLANVPASILLADAIASGLNGTAAEEAVAAKQVEQAQQVAAVVAQAAQNNVTLATTGTQKTENETAATNAASYSSWNELRTLVTAPDSQITNATAVQGALATQGIVTSATKIGVTVPQDPVELLTTSVTTTTPCNLNNLAADEIMVPEACMCANDPHAYGPSCEGRNQCHPVGTATRSFSRAGNGTCYCKFNWQGSQCHHCAEGYYGSNCDHQCNRGGLQVTALSGLQAAQSVSISSFLACGAGTCSSSFKSSDVYGPLIPARELEEADDAKVEERAAHSVPARRGVHPNPFLRSYRDDFDSHVPYDESSQVTPIITVTELDANCAMHPLINRELQFREPTAAVTAADLIRSRRTTFGSFSSMSDAGSSSEAIEIPSADSPDADIGFEQQRKVSEVVEEAYEDLRTFVLPAFAGSDDGISGGSEIDGPAGAAVGASSRRAQELPLSRSLDGEREQTTVYYVNPFTRQLESSNAAALRELYVNNTNAFYANLDPTVECACDAGFYGELTTDSARSRHFCNLMCDCDANGSDGCYDGQQPGVTGTGICKCKPHFAAPKCASCEAGWFPQGNCTTECVAAKTCHGQGTCNQVTGECQCENGYSGTYCTCPPCVNGGQCSGGANSHCVCINGYVGNRCHLPPIEGGFSYVEASSGWTPCEYPNPNCGPGVRYRPLNCQYQNKSNHDITMVDIAYCQANATMIATADRTSEVCVAQTNTPASCSCTTQPPAVSNQLSGGTCIGGITLPATTCQPVCASGFTLYGNYECKDGTLVPLTAPICTADGAAVETQEGLASELSFSLPAFAAGSADETKWRNAITASTKNAVVERLTTGGVSDLTADSVEVTSVTFSARRQLGAEDLAAVAKDAWQDARSELSGELMYGDTGSLLEHDAESRRQLTTATQTANVAFTVMAPVGTPAADVGLTASAFTTAMDQATFLQAFRNALETTDPTLSGTSITGLTVSQPLTVTRQVPTGSTGSSDGAGSSDPFLKPEIMIGGGAGAGVLVLLIFWWAIKGRQRKVEPEEQQQLRGHDGQPVDIEIPVEEPEIQIAEDKTAKPYKTTTPVIYPDGSRYEGWMLGGKKHGPGSYILSDGSYFEGQFANGIVNGYGKIEWNEKGFEKGNSKKYVGQWQDGHMHGKGLMYWPNNWVFVGDFRDDDRHGRGRCEWLEGAFYDGQWVDGVMNGLGEHGTAIGGSGMWIWKDGNTQEFVKRTKNPHRTSKVMQIKYTAGPVQEKDPDVFDDRLEVSIPELGIRVGNPKVWFASSGYNALTVTKIVTEGRGGADEGSPEGAAGGFSGSSSSSADQFRMSMVVGNKQLFVHSTIIAVNGEKASDAKKLLDLLTKAARGIWTELELTVLPPNVEAYMHGGSSKKKVKRMSSMEEFEEIMGRPNPEDSEADGGKKKKKKKEQMY